MVSNSPLPSFVDVIHHMHEGTGGGNKSVSNITVNTVRSANGFHARSFNGYGTNEHAGKGGTAVNGAKQRVRCCDVCFRSYHFFTSGQSPWNPDESMGNQMSYSIRGGSTMNASALKKALGIGLEELELVHTHAKNSLAPFSTYLPICLSL